MAITLDRTTVLQADIGQVSLQRPEFHYQRRASDIGGRLQSGVSPGRNVFLTPRKDAWILTPRGASDPMDLVRLPLPPEPAGILDVSTAFAGPDVQSEPMWKTPSDIPGMQTDPTLIPSGAPAFQRGIPAGVDPSTRTLAADAAAWVSPGGPFISAWPLDRQIAGKKTHQDNAPFLLLFAMPLEFIGTSIFLSFHFGGPTDVTAAGHSGGEYCLMLSGAGKGFLFERDKFIADQDKWVFRKELNLPGTRNPKGGIYTLRIVPYGRSRFAFIEDSIDAYAVEAGVMSRFAIPLGPGRLLEERGEFYFELPAETGHAHFHSATGPGPVRLDMRRDYMGPLIIAAMDYPLSGTLLDTPFTVPNLPGGTQITVRLDTYLPPGTSVTAQLYEADTGAACSFDVGSGTFASIAGHTRYRAGFTLGTTNGLQTPLLLGYSAHVPSYWYEVPKVPIVTSWLHHVNITGPDTDPADETAFLHVNDPDDQLLVLRVRDRVRCLVSVVSPSLNRVVAHLGEYESIQIPAKKRGKPAYQWPGENWWEFPNAAFQGLWARIVDRFQRPPGQDFSEDLTAPLIATGALSGRHYPWKFTSIIRYAFNVAGFPDDELDIPDVELRLWVPDTDLFFGGQFLAFGADFGRLIQTIARDYLNGVIIRDPNAGARGMWRLIFAPPASSTNYLANFLITDPGVGHPHEVMAVNSYSNTANVVPFRDGTFNYKHEAPEFTECHVYGIDASGGIIEATKENPNAYNESHPDWVGRFKPYYRVPDAGLPTQQAANWVAQQLYDNAGHGRDWWEGQAPLLLIRDPLDSLQNSNLFRPLRINDKVLLGGTLIGNLLVGGVPGLIKSCNPRYSSADSVQLADYEGFFLT